MTKVRTTLLEITDLENLDLKTKTIDGKRHYLDGKGNAYPSVTTVAVSYTHLTLPTNREV